jgi:hypothetical protein
MLGGTHFDQCKFENGTSLKDFRWEYDTPRTHGVLATLTTFNGIINFDPASSLHDGGIILTIDPASFETFKLTSTRTWRVDHHDASLPFPESYEVRNVSVTSR